MEENLDDAALAEGLVDAEKKATASPEENSNVCLNCNTPLTGPYCHNCGQKNFPRRQDIGDFIVNFISSFYSFESKFFKTFRFLLFRPGRIINDYNAGKRESYFHPARMYVFLSFIFFLILSFIPDEDKLDINSNGKKLSEKEKAQLIDSLSMSMDSIKLAFDTINWGNTKFSNNDPKTLAEYDSLENLKAPNARDGAIERYFTEKFIKLKQESGDDTQVILKNFFQSFLDNIPRMIFLLLPVFALILKLLYIRRDFYYSEHLVFSVFFYDFMYLAGSFNLIFSQIDWLEWVQPFLMLLLFFYLYKAMRKVYKQPRAKTVIKFFLFNMIFFSCLVIAFMLNALVTLMMM